MKKFLIATMCLAASAGVSQAFAAQVLTVNGEKVEKTATRMTFDGDNVIVHYDDNTSSTHDMADVKMAFEGSSSIAGLTFSKLNVTVGALLEVEGIEPGTELSVFDIRGRMVAAARSAAESCSIDIAGLESGVYLLKAGNEIVKFVKH